MEVLARTGTGPLEGAKASTFFLGLEAAFDRLRGLERCYRRSEPAPHLETHFLNVFHAVLSRPRRSMRGKNDVLVLEQRLIRAGGLFITNVQAESAEPAFLQRLDQRP